MSMILDSALARAANSSAVFAKFLSANDTGLTGGHQSGIYIPRHSASLIFIEQFERGENHKRSAYIIWNDERETESSFTYYGQGTRNEYRITRFGRGFDLLAPEHTGDLLVICRDTYDLYHAYVLSTENDIEAFLDAFSLAPIELNRLVFGADERQDNNTRPSFEAAVEEVAIRFEGQFPNTATMASSAQEASSLVVNPYTVSPDEAIITWIETEYKLFRRIEEVHYEWVTLEPADSLDDFVNTGLEITNRRKSRAGKSLEHHLEALFDLRGLKFKSQAITEVNKKPDFIFPSEEAYHDPDFPEEQLVFLGAKTTCKDRWRQVLNEANRIPHKYLFTLQQGMSPNQLKEMRAENLTLVVPAAYHSTYPETYRDQIMTLEEFIEMVVEIQSKDN